MLHFLNVCTNFDILRISSSVIDRVGTNTIMSRNIKSLRGITLGCSGFNGSGPRIEEIKSSYM